MMAEFQIPFRVINNSDEKKRKKLHARDVYLEVHKQIFKKDFFSEISYVNEDMTAQEAITIINILEQKNLIATTIAANQLEFVGKCTCQSLIHSVRNFSELKSVNLPSSNVQIKTDTSNTFRINFSDSAFIKNKNLKKMLQQKVEDTKGIVFNKKDNRSQNSDANFVEISAPDKIELRQKVTEFSTFLIKQDILKPEHTSIFLSDFSNQDTILPLRCLALKVFSKSEAQQHSFFSKYIAQAFDGCTNSHEKTVDVFLKTDSSVFSNSGMQNQARELQKTFKNVATLTQVLANPSERTDFFLNPVLQALLTKITEKKEQEEKEKIKNESKQEILQLKLKHEKPELSDTQSIKKIKAENLTIYQIKNR